MARLGAQRALSIQQGTSSPAWTTAVASSRLSPSFLPSPSNPHSLPQPEQCFQTTINQITSRPTPLLPPASHHMWEGSQALSSAQAWPAQQRGLGRMGPLHL